MSEASPETAQTHPLTGTAPVGSVQPPKEALARAIALPRWVLAAVASVAAVALLLSAALWQKLGHVQEQLARQSADAGALSAEARSTAKQAAELARETAARLAVVDAKVSEYALQRSQLEELMQSLSRSRDENLVVDIESAVRLAQQQAQLTGSLEPLIAALKTADLRVQRAAQPRLAGLQRAIAKDLGRIQSSAVTDTPGLLVKLDELVRLADELPLANAVGLPLVAQPGPTLTQTTQTAVNGRWWLDWWYRAKTVFKTESQRLLRVSRIELPEAALLSPEQAFFVRENLKLKLLNARLGLLARQLESARADIAGATAVLNRYFDAAARKTQTASDLMQTVQTQMRTLELPRVDETLAALSTAAAGR